MRALKDAVLNHINSNKLKYFLLILSLCIGAVAGFIFVGLIPASDSTETADFIQKFCKQFNLEPSASWTVFYKSITINLRFLLIIWICGMIFVIRPLVLAAIGIKGFSAGFTMGFMTLHFGAKGFLLSFVSILPQCLTLIPLLIYFSTCALSAASQGKQAKDSRSTTTVSPRNLTINWSLRCGVFALLLLGCSLIDAFIVPVFVGGVSKLF